jgi:hypothetical protein
MKNNIDKIINVATNYLANIIKELLLAEEIFTCKKMTNETRNYYNNLIAEFSNDIKNELKNTLEKQEKTEFFCDGSFYSKILNKFYVEKYYDIYLAMPTHVKISITKDYICDGNFCASSRERFYVVCSKEYMEKNIDYYEHAKENGYAFDDAEEYKEDLKKFLEKCDGNYYVQKEYKTFLEDDDNIENFDNFSDNPE